MSKSKSHVNGFLVTEKNTSISKVAQYARKLLPLKVETANFFTTDYNQALLTFSSWTTRLTQDKIYKVKLL